MEGLHKSVEFWHCYFKIREPKRFSHPVHFFAFSFVGINNFGRSIIACSNGIRPFTLTLQLVSDERQIIFLIWNFAVGNTFQRVPLRSSKFFHCAITSMNFVQSVRILQFWCKDLKQKILNLQQVLIIFLFSYTLCNALRLWQHLHF